MSAITANFRFRNKSGHPDGTVSFLRAIDYTQPEYRERSKNLVLQVYNINGGAGGPYHVEFNVDIFATAVVKIKSGAVVHRELAAYQEIGSNHAVLEDVGAASTSFHLDMPDLSQVDIGVGVVGIFPGSYVAIRDRLNIACYFTALGIPVVPGLPLNQRTIEQVFAIVGEAA